MTNRKPRRSIPILCLGATMLAGFAAGCGVEVQRKVPTLHARAVLAPATFSAESQPSTPTSHTAPPAQSGYEAMPSEVATAGQYQQSGGATPETAEVVTVGSTLIG